MPTLFLGAWAHVQLVHKRPQIAHEESTDIYGLSIYGLFMNDP